MSLKDGVRDPIFPDIQDQTKPGTAIVLTNDWKQFDYFFMLRLSSLLSVGKLSGVKK